MFALIARRIRFCLPILLLNPAVLPSAYAAMTVAGTVVDSNGNPVTQAQVIYERGPSAAGATVVTVFTDDAGTFAFPDRFPEPRAANLPVRARALGYTQHSIGVDAKTVSGDEQVRLLIILRPTANQAAVAPASAWLARIADRAAKSQFVMDCIDCHQVPASEVRAYAGTIADLHGTGAAAARQQSWNMIAQYMNYLSAWEFSRGGRTEDEPPAPDRVYGVNNGDAVAATLAQHFSDRLDTISGYAWGAPLAVNAATVIYEYEIPGTNAVREAMMLGDPRQLWVADVSSNRMFTIDVATGRQQINEAPIDVLMGPHSLHRDHDGGLWVTPLFNGIVGRVDPASKMWQTWKLRTPAGGNIGIHDLSFGYQHELLTDAEGRIWYSDIANNAVGYFDPATSKTEIFPAPEVPGRPSQGAMLYGLIMNRDRNEVWYSQLGIGSFGGFNIDKREFVPPIALPDQNAGPRRITINDEDVMYITLYGAGQLLEYDTRARKLLGIYDLPDTGSAPYSATWDPVRRVVWVVTSNGDVIYRFDPKTKAISVLPLPREQAFLRMVDIDPATGVLITSYANIVDIVQGPRMALIIDPGDGAYPQRFVPAGKPSNTGN